MPQVVDEGKRHWECDHEWQEFIDPHSGGFMRCKKCGRTLALIAELERAWKEAREAGEAIGILPVEGSPLDTLICAIGDKASELQDELERVRGDRDSHRRALAVAIAANGESHKERDALREQVQGLLDSSASGYVAAIREDAQQQNQALREQVARLEADGKRLDWLGAHCTEMWTAKGAIRGFQDGTELRESIDSASGEKHGQATPAD